MIEKCADMIVDWLVKCDAIKETEKEIYSYAIYSLFLAVSPFFLALVLGVLMGCIRQSIIIVIPFMIIRKYSGGYHQKNLWSCLLCSSLLLLLCIKLSLHCKFGWLLVVFTTISAISLIIFSPVDNDNRPLSKDDVLHFKQVITIIVVIMLLIGFCLTLAKLYTFTVCLYIGIMLSSGLQIPCILKQIIKND